MLCWRYNLALWLDNTQSSVKKHNLYPWSATSIIPCSFWPLNRQQKHLPRHQETDYKNKTGHGFKNGRYWYHSLKTKLRPWSTYLAWHLLHFFPFYPIFLDFIHVKLIISHRRGEKFVTFSELDMFSFFPTIFICGISKRSDSEI